MITFYLIFVNFYWGIRFMTFGKPNEITCKYDSYHVDSRYKPKLSLCWVVECVQVVGGGLL